MVNEVCLRTLDLDRPWLLEQYRSRGGYEILTKILKEQDASRRRSSKRSNARDCADAVARAFPPA